LARFPLCDQVENVCQLAAKAMIVQQPPVIPQNVNTLKKLASFYNKKQEDAERKETEAAATATETTAEAESTQSNAEKL